MDIGNIQKLGERLSDNVSQIIVGKDKQVLLAITAMFAGGHILLEDVPGSGKTVLAKSLAKSINGEFRRIQFTPDLLPADITGINYFNVKNSEFEFMKGPVFTNILLADEINRATPKTQAGLLEGMEEHQVTIDGITYPLERPYLVIATQNPIDTQGVFPLPEAQLDRFFIRLSLGYPDFESSVAILKDCDTESKLHAIQPVLSKEEITEANELIKSVRLHDDIIKYIVMLTEKTRELNGVILGISQRGSLALLRFSQTYAALHGREYVIPDDVKAGVVPVFAHRLILSGSERIHKNAAENKLKELLDSVPVPTEFIV